MTAPFLRELDPLEELKQLRASAGDDPLEQLKASKRRPSVRGAAPDATHALPSSRDDAGGDFEAAAPTLLGPLAVLSRDIPGAEAAQAGVRSLVRGQSYRDARSDIRQAEDAAPAAVRIPARIAGGALAAATIPGGPALQGARFGMLQGLAQSNPDASVKGRLHDAALGGAVGGTTGAIASNAARIPWGGLAKAVTAPRHTAVKAIGGVIRDAIGEAHAPVASEVAEAVVPSVDGFLGNSMDNVVDAAKARSAPANSHPAASFDERLNALLAAVRNDAPRGEALGNRFTDSQLAQGMDAEPMNLQDMLEQSLQHIQTGGTLSSARRGVPTYAGRPVSPRIP